MKHIGSHLFYTPMSSALVIVFHILGKNMSLPRNLFAWGLFNTLMATLSVQDNTRRE